MSSYCDIALDHPLHGPYHALEYGFPVEDEAVLFERLSLEIFQAGLSWHLVLARRPGLNHAFDGFSVDQVAAYTDEDRERLLADPQVIRNRLKINATIENARRIQSLRGDAGGFAAWLANHHPRTEAEWLKLFRQAFRFIGPEIVREFLLSVGYLPGAHREDCPIYRVIAEKNPPWLHA